MRASRRAQLRAGTCVVPFILPTPVEPAARVLGVSDYERCVEAPRRAGRDPVWDALWAEALAGQPQERAS